VGIVTAAGGAQVPDGPARIGPFRVLLPLLNPALGPPLLELGARLAGGPGGQVLLLSVAEVADEASLSQGLPLARAYRTMMSVLERSGSGVEARSLVRVFHDVAAGIRETAQETASDLLLLPWKGFARGSDRVFGELLDRLVGQPPCDVVLARLPVPAEPWRVLVAARGGTYAELAVDIGERLAGGGGRLTVVHAAPTRDVADDRPFEVIRARLADAQRSPRVIELGGDPRDGIMREAAGHNVVILGATGRAGAVSPLGPLGDQLARDLQKGLLIVKTRSPLRLPTGPHGSGPPPGQVDRWFAENTYQYREFSDIGRLVDLKRRRGLTISLGLPAHNAEGTIVGVLKATHGLLQQEYPLLDEVVVLDRGSTDGTREAAAELGVTVHPIDRGRRRQRGVTEFGTALWKSLRVLRGDLIVWLDPSIRNPHPRFVYGVLGPLLSSPGLAYVLGFSCRSGDSRPDQSIGGDGVTELAVRPLLNLLAPELAGIIQPLSEQRAGRRDVLEQVPFFSGRGVEVGLLLDVHAREGLRGIAQVDVGERVQHEGDGRDPLPTAHAALRVLLRRLGQRQGLDLLDRDRLGLTRIRCENGEYFLDVRDVAEEEHPPVASRQ